MSGLRKRITKIGQQVLDNYCLKGDEIRGRIMIPPIPDSKFIDKLPEDVELEGQNAAEKELQEGYEAEVKVYRCLEEVESNVIVIHQLDYTHEQYAAFLPNHPCNAKMCKRGLDTHDCHQPKKNVEGETDFVVIGMNFVAVLEVKGLSLQSCTEDVGELIMKGCVEDASRQRKRMVDLIRSVESTLMVYEFTLLTSVSREEVDEKYLSDETLLFSEDLDHLVQIIDSCEVFSSNALKPEIIKNMSWCLLGLWCIDQDNKWDITTCSLPKCIMDIDSKLRRALVTRKSVDEVAVEANRPSNKNKGRKKTSSKKQYPKNLEMVDAPSLFEKYLNVKTLTKDQLDIFESKERFLWVEGPAGSGKTVVMLGKIIHLALTTPPEKRILLVIPGAYKRIGPMVERHLSLLNNVIEDVTLCKKIVYVHDNYSDNVDEAGRSMLQQMSDSSSKIILLLIKETSASASIKRFMTNFEYVFFDDFQTLIDIHQATLLETGNMLIEINTILEGILPIVKKSTSSTTSVWILCDYAQSTMDRSYRHFVGYLVSTFGDELRSYFVDSKQLTVNLRNTCEISTVLSIIRTHCEKIVLPGATPVTWPKQKEGHFLHGIKPVIYLIRESKTTSWIDILTRELGELKGSNCCLKSSDIAVLLAIDPDDITSLTNLESILERWNTPDDKIQLLLPGWSVSAEWPVVISLFNITSTSTAVPVTLTDYNLSHLSICFTLPLYTTLYTTISRARVYSTVIIFDYTPNTCQYFDNCIEELKQRRDVCRIVEMH